VLTGSGRPYLFKPLRPHRAGEETCMQVGGAEAVQKSWQLHDALAVLWLWGVTATRGVTAALASRRWLAGCQPSSPFWSLDRCDGGV
jgi:hypothetical protein